MPVRSIRLNHKGRPEPYLINEEHKTILRHLDKQSAGQLKLLPVLGIRDMTNVLGNIC